MPEHAWAVFRQILNELDGLPLGPAEQSGEPSLALDQRQVAQIVAVLTASLLRRRLRSAWKSGMPSPLTTTASPSIRNECASRRAAASTMEGKRSAQSLPLRVKQRMQEPSR